MIILDDCQIFILVDWSLTPTSAVFQLHRVFCLIINDIEIMYIHVTFHSHRTCNELQAFVALGDVNQTLAATIILYKCFKYYAYIKCYKQYAYIKCFEQYAYIMCFEQHTYIKCFTQYAYLNVSNSMKCLKYYDFEFRILGLTPLSTIFQLYHGDQFQW